MSEEIEKRPRLKLFDGQKAPMDFLSDVEFIKKVDVNCFKFLIDMAIQNKLIPIPLTEETHKNIEAKTGCNPSQALQVFRFCNQVLNKLIESKLEQNVITSELTTLGVPDKIIQTVLVSYNEKKQGLMNMRVALELVLLPYPSRIRWRVSFGYAESAIPYFPTPKVTVNIICGTGSGNELDYCFEMSEEEFEYVLGELHKAQSEFNKLKDLTPKLRKMFSEAH